eukprot:gene31587-39017_t
MKLANQGVTITVASGDNGAPDANNAGVCMCSSKYNPSFPATSPYVTAVGATMGPENGDTEVACQSNLGGVVTSGGGFSTYFTALEWQTAAVDAYFAGLTTAQTPVSGYNRNGRAYPDVSLIGVDYQVVIGGYMETIFGTSASAPVFAAFVSLVNAARLEMGLTTIGFLNPTLYTLGMNASSPYKFNDITSGDNKCCAYGGNNPSQASCCTSGFTATAGWDPVTGARSNYTGTSNGPTIMDSPHHINPSASYYPGGAQAHGHVVHVVTSTDNRGLMMQPTNVQGQF